MEFQKIVNLLDNASNQPSRFIDLEQIQVTTLNLNYNAKI